MNFRLILVVSLSFLFSSPLYSQGKLKNDSVVVYRPEKFHKYVINIDNRNSFIGGETISILGIKTGISVHHRWRFGLGYHQILFPVSIDYTYQSQVYKAKLSFWYLSTYAEWVIIHRKQYELSAPLTYGVGGAPILSFTPGKPVPGGNRNTLQLLELSLLGYYKIFDWIGPGLGVGYRFMLNANTEVKNRFDAPVYVLRVQIFLDPLYHDLFPKGIGKKKED